MKETRYENVLYINPEYNEILRIEICLYIVATIGLVVLRIYSVPYLPVLDLWKEFFDLSISVALGTAYIHLLMRIFVYPPKAFEIKNKSIKFVWYRNRLESYSVDDIIAYYYEYVRNGAFFYLYVKVPGISRIKKIDLTGVEANLQRIILNFLDENGIPELKRVPRRLLLIGVRIKDSDLKKKVDGGGLGEIRRVEEGRRKSQMSFKPEIPRGSNVLYDMSDTPVAAERKYNAFFKYRRDRVKEYLGFPALYFFVLICYLYLRFVGGASGGPYHLKDIIMMVSGVLSIMTARFYDKKGLRPMMRYQLLDVIVREDGIVMPEWQTRSEKKRRIFQWSEKTAFYPWDYVDRIYWNRGMDYLLLIKSDRGMVATNSKERYECIFRSIIDDEEGFREALRRTGKLVEDEIMTKERWLKLEKIRERQKRK